MGPVCGLELQGLRLNNADSPETPTHASRVQ